MNRIHVIDQGSDDAAIDFDQGTALLLGKVMATFSKLARAKCCYRSIQSATEVCPEN